MARTQIKHIGRAPTFAQDRANSARILAIRAKAGNPCDYCPTCTRAPFAPFRRLCPTTGRTLAGCVDACHTGHLVAPSGSHEWHSREQARIIRRETLNILLARR